MSTAPAIASPREAWLAERRKIITASDVAAILGADERRGPLAVYAAKIAGIESEETLPMRRGRRYQAVIAEDYSEQTGRAVSPWPEFEIVMHPTIPYLGATLDALTRVEWCPEMPLEIKLGLGSAAAWKDEAPLSYQCQAQVQAACFGSPTAALAGLIGPGPLATHDLARDDAFLSAAVPFLERFLWHVERQIPPEADGKAGTTAAIRAIWADEDGETVDLDDAAAALVLDWEQAKQSKTEAEKSAEGLENRIRTRLGAASFGKLPDGSYLTLRLTERQGYTTKTTSFRTLRHKSPRRPRR